MLGLVSLFSLALMTLSSKNTHFPPFLYVAHDGRVNLLISEV